MDPGFRVAQQDQNAAGNCKANHPLKLFPKRDLQKVMEAYTRQELEFMVATAKECPEAILRANEIHGSQIQPVNEKLNGAQ